MFSQGQPLDATKYYLILPANIGQERPASHDYESAPDLEKITAPLLAVNFADDLIIPPELGILEREIKRAQQGKAIVMPMSNRSRGHGTHTLAAVWQQHLADLLKRSKRR